MIGDIVIYTGLEKRIYKLYFHLIVGEEKDNYMVRCLNRPKDKQIYAFMKSTKHQLVKNSKLVKLAFL